MSRESVSWHLSRGNTAGGRTPPAGGRKEDDHVSGHSLARRKTGKKFQRGLAVLAAGALALGLPALAAPAASAGGQDDPHKVWVCKYVGKPGVDEELKSGKQPISVDASATDGTGVGGYFNDAQGRSFVVAIDDGSGSPGASACPAPDGGPVVEEDASASVSTVPATCASGEVLEYGGIENASFSGTADGAEGPGSYDVTATADAGHAFAGGDTTREFSGSLDGPLSGADCAGPQPSDETDTRDVEDAPDCSASTVTIQHQERTRSYELDGDTWVPGSWSEWTTVGTDTRSATVAECPPPVTKVAIPDMPATLDPCNGAGVTNNVAWAGSLPASNAQVSWSEDPDTHVRTASLVGDAEWTDGSKDPKVYALPSDDGRACEVLVPVPGSVTTTLACEGVMIDGSNWEGGSIENGTGYGVSVYANGVLQHTESSPTGPYTAIFAQNHADWYTAWSTMVTTPDQAVDTTWRVEVTVESYSQDYGPFTFGPWTQPACITPPVKVDIPAAPGVNDPCNPVGIGNNVTWKDPLPADTDHVKWVEDSLARTASLVGDNVQWTDGTTVPKVYRLPGDSGEACVVVTTPVTTTPPATTSPPATTPVTTSPAASTPVTTTAASQPPVATTNQPVAVNPPPADQGAQPAPAAPVAAAEAAPADAGSPQVADNQPGVSMGAPPPPEAGDVAAAPPVHHSSDGLLISLSIVGGLIFLMVVGCVVAPRFGGRR